MVLCNIFVDRRKHKIYKWKASEQQADWVDGGHIKQGIYISESRVRLRVLCVRLMNIC